MPWRCPVCGTAIRHDASEPAPRPQVIYYCHACRLTLVVNKWTRKLAAAPVQQGADPTPDKRWQPRRSLSPKRRLLIVVTVSAVAVLFSQAVSLLLMKFARVSPDSTATELDVTNAELRLATLARRSAAFFATSPVRRDTPANAILEIGLPGASPEAVEAELQRWSGERGITASGPLTSSARMRADLVSEQECTITPLEPLDQWVSSSDRTFWRWSITPRVNGPLRLNVTISAMSSGIEQNIPLVRFRKTVTVFVTTVDRVTDTIDWATDHWVLMAAAWAGIGAVGIFGWHRRKGAGFVPPG